MWKPTLIVAIAVFAMMELCHVMVIIASLPGAGGQ